MILQGRIFAARDTLQYCTIPLGYLLGGFFVDYVFEPFMQSNVRLRYLFKYIVGEGKGAGNCVNVLNYRNTRYSDLFTGIKL